MKRSKIISILEKEESLLWYKYEALCREAGFAYSAAEIGGRISGVGYALSLLKGETPIDTLVKPD